MMRVLVTGVSGYIGSRLLELFDDDDDIDSIVGLDIVEPRGSSDKLVFEQRSVTDDFSDVAKAHDVDAAVHLAFVIDPLHDASRQRAINVGGTQNFLQACADAGVSNITLASSATAYGAHADNPVPLLEDHPVRATPSYQYAYEKLLLEQFAEIFARENPSSNVKRVRPTIVCGPNISNFIGRSLTKAVMPLVWGYDPPYQLVHEEDVARAFYQIVKRGTAGAYNVAPPDWAPMSELAEIAQARPLWLPHSLAKPLMTFGWHARIKAISEAPPGLLDFIMHPWVVKPVRLQEELDFEFSEDTRETLRIYLRAHRNGG